MGGIRLEAYIAKSVSRVVGPVASGVAPEPAPSATTRAESRAGMTVAHQRGAATSWLQPVEATVRVAPGRQGDLAASAAALPEPGAEPPAGRAPATFVWVLPSDTPEQRIDDPRPAFIVQFSAVPGLAPDRLTAALVRLVAVPDGSLAVAAVPGRADQAIWGDADWDVMRTIEQQDVRAQVQPLEPGAVRVQSEANLAPGRYAVVVRPSTRDRLAGADVLADKAEGQVFTTAFPFTIR
jgi:hypothetical protein